MATTLYLPSTGLPAVNPDPSINWNNVASMDRRAMVTTKLNSAVLNKQIIVPTTALTYICFAQYISDTIAAQTIAAQLVQLQIRAQEGSVSTNAFVVLALWICSNNGLVRRATLLDIAAGIDDLEISAVQLTNRTLQAMTTEGVALNGDRIVAEIGVVGDPVSTETQINCSIQFRDNGTDLPVNDTHTAAGDPWISFPNTITGFGTPPDAPTGMPPGILHQGRSLVR